MPRIVEHIYGAVPAEWEMLDIGHLVKTAKANLQTGPFGTMLRATEYVPHGTPVVAVKNIGDNALLHHNDIPRIDEATRQRLSKYELQLGDILFGRKGGIERRALVRQPEVGWLQGSDCIRLRSLTPDIDPIYLSYVFGTPQHREWITRNAQGATMPSLNQEILERVPVPLPPLPEQKAIAHILGTLDDKIEMNRQMNETLDALAQAIFRSWFVDFDPVWAKREGRSTGLEPALAALFPDSFVDSELGEIPAGWEVGTIGDLVTVVGGGTPSTKNPDYWEGGIHYFATPKDLSGLQTEILLETERKVTDSGLTRISSGLLPVGTVLLSSRAPIGYRALARVPVCINQGFIGMVCDGPLSNYYVLNWVRANLDVIKGNAGGTTFPEISKTNFRPILALVPQADVLQMFDQLVAPLYARIQANEEESRTLAEVRDTLLPKLVSGELRVGDVENGE